MRICFYSAVRDPALLDLLEFYQGDLRALREIGHDVRIATTPRELRGSADAFWVWWPTSGAPALAWARLRGRPAVLVSPLSTRDPTPSGFYAKPPWTRAVAHWSVRAANVTLAVSDEAARGMEALHPRLLRAAPHAVDTERYAPDSSGPAEPRYALTVSQLTTDNVARKRLREVVRAAALVRDSGDPLQFVIAGDWGEGAPGLQAEIRACGVEDRVRLTGRVSAEEKLELLRRAAVYLQPTYYESFGLAIAEAMACALPVVSHSVGAVPEVVGETERLLPVEAGPAELASAAVELAGPAGRALGEHARARVVERFSPASRRAAVAEALTLASS